MERNKRKSSVTLQNKKIWNVQIFKKLNLKKKQQQKENYDVKHQTHTYIKSFFTLPL